MSMIVNPKTLSWAASTTNVDGTPITYELEYEVGLQAGSGPFERIMTIPGSLRSDERYEAPIADIQLPPGKYVMALRSFAKEDPERVSEWSEPVTFAISDEIPNAPLELRVT
ncbi:hypothetical protein SAMN04488490_1834 [Marinobacter sp. LV10R510-11A]|uniref:hypothetical protein n=1 Tax=Marinobacter sp. LV10R510-11A TaxID=1415568 RepID=UPI000BB8A91D|nr:hypothetical protein [Marinobacter sp. LV10R510-11A]SOB76157.1 hypothetical protein SAMN04488490_1834 [Marinobacter sp. LV10R510-11A]